jgi:hypothetical protein
MAAAAGQLGQEPRVREALSHLHRLEPSATLSLPGFRVFADPARRERLLGGLRKAGLVEAS